MGEPLSKTEARSVVERAIELAEGRANPEPGELAQIGVRFVLDWQVLFPELVAICGSEEAALARVKLMKELVAMGVADTQTVN